MRRPTILVADDDAHFRAAMRRRLRPLGYRVIEARDGLDVLRECPQGRIDVVLLDHGMPNGDGRSVARMIRKESDVPIVFVSGYHREQFRSIVAELPDVYYLPKPFGEETLQDLLRALVKGIKLAATSA